MSVRTNSKPIPQALKMWFIIHFIADLFFAIPLMIAPVFSLELVGWQNVDPMATRMIAAALFGIGIESYLGRNAGVEAYQGMLNLKIIWSLAVILGVGVSMIQGAQGRPVFGWMLLLIFLAFNLVWVYWRVKLGKEFK